MREGGESGKREDEFITMVISGGGSRSLECNPPKNKIVGQPP